VNDTRAAFEAGLGFGLDPFQRDAFDALDAGRSVLVAAPTGSGKTLVAEYAIARALATGRKVFYTTPLKALSNQKFGDLVRAHGAERVGLLTGDNSINGEAQVVVMTTEVLRNMIYAASATLDGLEYVVLDEVHYLQDRARGPVWEEVIIHLPATVDLVCLSATVSNAEEFADWINTVRGDTVAIIEERRPVELQHLYAVAERNAGVSLLPTFIGRSGSGDPKPNPEAMRLDAKGHKGPPGRGRPRTRLFPPGRLELVELLDDEDMLPAIVFVFSRAGCDAAVTECVRSGIRLTSPEERAEIRRIAEAHTTALSEGDLDVLGYDLWLAGIEAGFAAHHAGMVPPMKEAVEEAFAAGLVKVVYATETLALGINMPARTVVIEKLSKFTGQRHEFLTPGEYTQLAGRAGRRGIDSVGYVVVCWSPWVPFEQVAGLASKRTYALTSSFRPTYNMAANLVRRYEPELAHHLLNLSFAQYRIDREVVSMERQLERSRAQLERSRAALRGSADGDVEEYRTLVAALDAERRERGSGKRVGEALSALRPGDVILVGRHGGRVVILRQEAKQRPPKVLALTASKDIVKLGADDFDHPPERVGRIELPTPFAPRSVAFRREAADRLRRVRIKKKGGRPRPSPLERELAERIRTHPVTIGGDQDALLAAAQATDRLSRDVERLERRVRRRTESLARQFDRVLRILEAWGYVDDWSLTEAGELLAGINTERDLLLAEALRSGLFDDVSPAEAAALVSCFTYERRGSDNTGPVAPERWPSHRVAQRAREVERIWRDLAAVEDEAGLPETTPPDPGFTALAAGWVEGEELGDLLLEDELTGGDFVRHIRQLVDLLRQVADVAPKPSTTVAARAAADACFRGVVAASSRVAFDAEPEPSERETPTAEDAE